MIGLGTIINCALVLLGGAAGMLFGQAVKPEMQEGMTKACGLSTIFIGAAGTLSRMLTVSEGTLSSGGSLILVLSMVLGIVTGSLLGISAKLERFGEWLKVRSHSEGDGRFMDGFTSASFTICIGAMAVIGPMNDALYHDYSLLITKGILDCIIVMALAASLGRGAVFSVIPLAIFQGAMTILACFVGPLLSAGALTALGLVGNVLIFAVGVNLVFKSKLPVADFLPALVFAVLLSGLPNL